MEYSAEMVRRMSPRVFTVLLRKPNSPPSGILETVVAASDIAKVAMAIAQSEEGGDGEIKPRHMSVACMMIIPESVALMPENYEVVHTWYGHQASRIKSAITVAFSQAKFRDIVKHGAFPEKKKVEVNTVFSDITNHFLESSGTTVDRAINALLWKIAKESVGE